MGKSFFQNFLDCPGEYQAAEDFWKTAFDLAIRAVGQSSSTWTEWRPRDHANGTPIERDGNPIFDALSKRLGRAIQIIQWPPDGEEAEISAWLSHLSVSDEHGNNVERILELTINLSLSEECAVTALALLSKCVDPTMTRDEMNLQIAKLPRPE